MRLVICDRCNMKKYAFSSFLITGLVVWVLVSLDGSLESYDSITPAFAFPPDQQAVVQSSWSLPASTDRIGGIVSDFAGNAYFPQTIQDKLGRLEPATNMVTEWEISGNDTTKAAPTGIAFDPTSGSIYFTEAGTDKIGRLEPATNTVTEWRSPNSTKNMILGDIVYEPGTGDVYFINNNGFAIKRLEPATNTFTEWTLPILSSNVSDIVSGFDSIYFTEAGTDKIGRLEPATNMVTEWEISGNDTTKAAPTGIAFDPTTGSIYFIESGTHNIGRLEPAREMITKWDVGTKPLTLSVTPAGSIFYTDDLGRIGRLG
jgi:streptogramin lyase